ncbi:hypothetical protein Pelo_1812 [Pelomyxa schiedti]|nr:hypothetical protein Pelo_1812 [Pelomyxa schiedti]
MKRRRRETTVKSTSIPAYTPCDDVIHSTTPSSMSLPPSSSLDQMVPPSVMELIVAFLFCPPFPTSSTTTATTTSSHKLGRTNCVINFALCSRACLAACDRVSMTMRVRSFVRPYLRLVMMTGDRNDDTVSEELVERDSDDERELEEAARGIRKALRIKSWVKAVHNSVLVSMRNKVPRHSAHFISCDVKECANCQQNCTEVAQQGEAWFFPTTAATATTKAVVRRDQRVYVHILGEMIIPMQNEDDDDREEEENEPHATVWYCIADTGNVPQPPPFWETRLEMQDQIQVLRQERDSGAEASAFAPWVKVYDTWSAYPKHLLDKHAEEVSQLAGVAALCALAGLPADQGSNLLKTLADAADCACLL